MRIVAGQLKGRRIEAPPSARPTADRVREALFSILGDVSGLAVLDLFAGSGALGIEALSRGAARAEFVDSSGRAVAAVKRNLANLGLRAEVHRRDALRFLDSRRGESPFGLVFLDPPYDCGPPLARRLAELLPPSLTEDALIVTESSTRDPLELPFAVRRERTYGSTRVVVHER